MDTLRKVATQRTIQEQERVQYAAGINILDIMKQRRGSVGRGKFVQINILNKSMIGGFW